MMQGDTAQLSFFAAFFAPQTRGRAIKVALLVGSLLNIINQGDALIAFEGVNWGKIVLTYLVPYLVSSYSVAQAQLEHQRLKG